MEMSCDLTRLADLISTSAKTIKDACGTVDIGPVSNGTFRNPAEHVASSQIAEALQVLKSATRMLDALVTRPKERIWNLTTEFWVSSVIMCAINLDVAEHLVNGPLSINELEDKMKCPKDKLDRLLRFLTIRHVFVEVSPGLFANNASSLELRKGTEFAAILGLVLNEQLMASTKLYDSLSSDKTAFQLANDTSLTFFQWLQTHPCRQSNFHKSMAGWSQVMYMEGIVKDYEWPREKNALVVDVAGGIGSIPSLLAQSFPNLRFVIQDQSLAIEQAKAYWRDSDTQVEFDVIDFCKEDWKTRSHAAIYILKSIIHNWDDDNALVILKGIRDSMGPESRLLCMDHLMEEGSLKSHHTYDPLPSNMGFAQDGAAKMDIIMMSLMNSRQRTQEQYLSLLKMAGLKVIKIINCRGGMSHKIIEAIVDTNVNDSPYV